MTPAQYKRANRVNLARLLRDRRMQRRLGRLAAFSWSDMRRLQYEGKKKTR